MTREQSTTTALCCSHGGLSGTSIALNAQQIMHVWGRLYAWTCTCIHTDMYIYIYVFMCMCTHMYMYIYTCIDIDIDKDIDIGHRHRHRHYLSNKHIYIYTMYVFSKHVATARIFSFDQGSYKSRSPVLLARYPSSSTPFHRCTQKVLAWGYSFGTLIN